TTHKRTSGLCPGVRLTPDGRPHRFLLLKTSLRQAAAARRARRRTLVGRPAPAGQARCPQRECLRGTRPAARTTGALPRRPGCSRPRRGLRGTRARRRPLPGSRRGFGPRSRGYAHARRRRARARRARPRSARSVSRLRRHRPRAPSARRPRRRPSPLPEGVPIIRAARPWPSTSLGSMRELLEVYFVDGVRSAFGRAGPKGVFWRTRADDMAVKLVRELLRRNDSLPPERIDDVVFAATAQV